MVVETSAAFGHPQITLRTKPLTDAELTDLWQQAALYPRRFRAAKALHQKYLQQDHPFIMLLRAEDFIQRITNPTPLDDLVDRLDLIKYKLIGIFPRTGGQQVAV